MKPILALAGAVGALILMLVLAWAFVIKPDLDETGQLIEKRDSLKQELQELKLQSEYRGRLET